MKPPKPPAEYCEGLIGSFKTKADHNKTEALWCFILVISCTLIAPLFVTLGVGLICGKIIPSVLSLLAAGATAWLQLRKPQSLWTLYRSIQRELEDALKRYEYQIEEYETAENPDKVLAARCAELALSAHHQWLPLVPTPERLEAAGEKGKSRKALPK